MVRKSVQVHKGERSVDGALNRKSSAKTSDISEEPNLFTDNGETTATRKKLSWRFVVGTLVGGLVLFVPVESHVTGEGIVITENRVRVEVIVSGVLSEAFKREGETVHEGETIARLKNNSLGRQLAEARFRRDALNIELETLVKKSITAQRKFERVGILHENRVAGRSELEKAELEFEEVRNQLRKIRQEAEVAKATAVSLEEVQKSLEIKSPINGLLLTDLAGRVGNYFREGDELLQIGDPAQLLIEVAVSEKSVSRLRNGDKAEVRFPALPGISSGRIYRIAPEAEEKIEKVFKVRTVVLVLVRLDQLPNDLKIGMRAEVGLSRKRVTLIHRAYDLMVSLVSERQSYIGPKLR